MSHSAKLFYQAGSESETLHRRITLMLIGDRLDGDPTVPNPVNPDEDVNRLEIRAVRKLVAKLRDLASIGERARLVADISAAAEIWSEAFDQFFPMPEDTEEGTQALAKSQAITVYA